MNVLLLVRRLFGSWLENLMMFLPPAVVPVVGVTFKHWWAGLQLFVRHFWWLLLAVYGYTVYLLPNRPELFVSPENWDFFFLYSFVTYAFVATIRASAGQKNRAYFMGKLPHVVIAASVSASLWRWETVNLPMYKWAFVDVFALLFGLFLLDTSLPLANIGRAVSDIVVSVRNVVVFALFNAPAWFVLGWAIVGSWLVSYERLFEFIPLNEYSDAALILLKGIVFYYLAVALVATVYNKRTRDQSSLYA